MNELIAKIEQWAEDRNIIKGSKPIDQAMKLFSEFGELADNVGKGRDCRDDIGDVFVVLTIISKQRDIPILKAFDKAQPYDEKSKQCIVYLSREITEFLTIEDEEADFMLSNVVDSLLSICVNNGFTLNECVTIAYNDIKDRKGLMHNGVFIKESDPAYQDALDNIEADKRMTTQKRISVNIEDL